MSQSPRFCKEIDRNYFWEFETFLNMPSFKISISFLLCKYLALKWEQYIAKQDV